MRNMLLAAMVAAWPVLALATPPDLDEEPEGHLPAFVHNLYRDAGLAEAARAADRKYVEGMHMHHQGAVTMSQDYLRDSKGSHPIIRKLAEAIIANQEFEIGVLAGIGRDVERGPSPIAVGMVTRPAGWDGVEHLTPLFVKHPAPGVLDLWLDRTPLSQRDVVFAKGMIIHHQAAVDMARAYNADRIADNPILKAMSRDIILDQAYEIALMRRLIQRYPGDASAIVIDPAMIPGMPHGGAGMSGMGRDAPTPEHGGGGGPSRHSGH
jgi:uncharacterized protein (DUF305 family)